MLQAERDPDGRPTFNVEIKLTDGQANALASPGDSTGDTVLIAKLTNPERRSPAEFEGSQSALKVDFPSD